MHTGGVTAWTSPAQLSPAERKFVQGFGRLRKGENRAERMEGKKPRSALAERGDHITGKSV